MLLGKNYLYVKIQRHKWVKIQSVLINVKLPEHPSMTGELPTKENLWKRNDECECTSSSLTNCLAVGADTMIRREVGEIKPSSTALSRNDNNEL